MTDHVDELAKTLAYDPYAITTDNDAIAALADPLARIATTIDQMSDDLGMSGIGADAAGESLARLSVDLRGHSDTVGQYAKIAGKALDAVGTAYDGYFDLPAGSLTSAQEQTYIANQAGTAITYIDQEMQQERQSAAAKVLGTLDTTVADQILALQAVRDAPETPPSSGSSAPGGGTPLPPTPAATLPTLPTATGGTGGGPAGGGTSGGSSTAGGSGTGLVGLPPTTHGGGTGSGTGGGTVSVDGPTTGSVPGLGSGGTGWAGSGAGGGTGSGSAAGGSWAGGLAGALTVGGGALGSRLSGAFAASASGSGSAVPGAVLGGPGLGGGTALTGGGRGGLGGGLPASGAAGSAGSAGEGSQAATRSGGTLVGSTGTPAGQPGGGAAASRGSAIGGMPGGGGAAGSSRSRRRTGSLGYLAPELDEDEVPAAPVASSAGMRAGTRETPVDVARTPEADDSW